MTHQSFDFKKVVISVLAGGMAGISVDFALFPVDSIKTRLQASTKNVNYTAQAKDVSKYKGFLSAMVASFPCAGMFWLSYEFSKYQLRNSDTSIRYLNFS